MKFFMSVDMEGISGIVHSSETGEDPGEYDRGRELMEGDVNAAIEGILDAGGDEVVVSDGHWGMRNLRPEELHEAAVLVRGSPKPLTQMEGIDPNFEAALFVGYHTMRGTKLGVLSHTISGSIVDSIMINGKEVGETGINAAISGYFGVPVVFVSGDLAVTEEARTLIPNVVTVAVKEAVSRTAARCLNPKKARALIRRGTAEAVRNRNSITPFSFSPPIDVQIKYVNALMVDVVNFLPFIERVDGRTVRFVLDDYLKAFRAARATLFMASTTLSR